MPYPLVERLKAYCAAKPGTIPQLSFTKNHMSYYILGDSRRDFAEFYLDEIPSRLQLRGHTSVLEVLQEKTCLQICDIRWDPPGWRYADVWLDGSLPEAELIDLLDGSYNICWKELNENETRLIQIADQTTSVRDALPHLIDMHELTHRYGEIEALIQPAILLRTSPAEEAQIPLGRSKIGGLPDLPVGWDFPHFEGKPLAFLAQINISEIPSELPKAPLPSTGILYLFSVFGWRKDDGDWPRDFPWEGTDVPGFSQVLYCVDQTLELKRTDKPEGINPFKSAAVSFERIISLPRVWDYARDPVLNALNWKEAEFERFDNLYFDINYILDYKLGRRPKHHLLGYPEAVQAPVTRPDTRLLCQIDSDYHHFDTDMMWGDGGLLYFMIAQPDLERSNFTVIYSDMQSG
jgi:uncharacterized protein YwqG